MNRYYFPTFYLHMSAHPKIFYTPPLFIDVWCPTIVYNNFLEVLNNKGILWQHSINVVSENKKKKKISFSGFFWLKFSLSQAACQKFNRKKNFSLHLQPCTLNNWLRFLLFTSNRVSLIRHRFVHSDFIYVLLISLMVKL